MTDANHLLLMQAFHFRIKKDPENISLDDVKSSESNAKMQVDNTTPATITSKVTCCAAGDLCTAPMGTKISLLQCLLCAKQMHSIEQPLKKQNLN